MSEEQTKAELEALRARVAELEAARDKPVKVEIEGLEGLEGLKQWSHAVETQQLDRFYTVNSVPDRVFYGWFWVIVIIGGLILGMAGIEWLAGHPVFFTSGRAG